jgi:antitoxin component YwqK of YwqJK toxin-antitoxin module
MRLMLSAFLLLCLLQANSQCKTYKISSKGDTLNCVDNNGTKRGKWVVHTDAQRGNPGFDEEGEYINDRREGIWRVYNLMGDLMAVKNYKWGNLDGISQYYNLAGLEKEESWYAVNPDKLYDTLEVQDIDDPNKYVPVVIKNEGKSLKHGTWKWYRPGSMTIVRTEVYVLNKLQLPGEKNAPVSDSTSAAQKPAPKKEKPKEVEQYEKKNSGKKIKVRDGKTG